MKENIILIIKGFIIGIANIIPGVSGGTLMITLGIYEKIINTISHFFKNIKENIKFILLIGIGLVLSILIFSNIISTSLDKFPFATTIFFLGLILGGIPMLLKKVKIEKNKLSNWIIFMITFAIVTIFAFLKVGNSSIDLNNLGFVNYIYLFLVGIISASTMIIPGISGSFVLMLLGYYYPIITTIKNITDFSNLGHNLLILIPFGLGIVVGIVLVSKLIEYLLKKYEVKTYFGVIGFVLASMIAIILPLGSNTIKIWEIVCSVVLFIIGFITAYKLGDK